MEGGYFAFLTSAQAPAFIFPLSTKIVGVVLLCFVAIVKFASMPLSFRCLSVVFCCDMKTDVPVLGAEYINRMILADASDGIFHGLSFLSFVVHKFGTEPFLANARQVREGASFMSNFKKTQMTAVWPATRPAIETTPEGSCDRTCNF